MQQTLPIESLHKTADSDNLVRWQCEATSELDVFALPSAVFDTTPIEALWEMHPTKFSKVIVYGKTYDLPRWQQSYLQPYKYSGVVHDALPLPGLLQPLVEWANTTVYGPFNQVLVNWYAGGAHCIGRHRDDEPEILAGSPIMTISLGGTRTFRIRGSGGECGTKSRARQLPTHASALRSAGFGSGMVKKRGDNNKVHFLSRSEYNTEESS